MQRNACPTRFRSGPTVPCCQALKTGLFHRTCPMRLNASCDLHTLYRRTEDYFFALLCLLHRRFSADTCAYFTAQKSSPFNVLSEGYSEWQLGVSKAGVRTLIQLQGFCPRAHLARLIRSPLLSGCDPQGPTDTAWPPTRRQTRSNRLTHR